VATGRQILHLFHQITREFGTTLLVATHDPLVDVFADVIYHLQDGRINGEL
jgi:ABC-type lipoprotein export system ATPase subunit